MKSFLFKFLIALCIISAAIVSSCKKQGDEISPVAYQVRFLFSYKVGSYPLKFDTIRYFNEFGNKYSVITLKYFISKIALHRTDGGILLFNEDNYIDASDTSTLTFVPSGKATPGMYTSINFNFGLDSLENVTGCFLNPPENKMEWPPDIGGGYHYMKLEGKFDSAGVIKNYQCHTGQLMGVPYYIKISLPVTFSVRDHDVTIQIIMDINEWWKNPNTLDLNNVTEIMMNPVYQRYIQENGADVFSVGAINK
jgi:hypothetical protein